MRTSDNSEYFEQRRLQSLKLAGDTTDQAVAHLHRDFAANYAAANEGAEEQRDESLASNVEPDARHDGMCADPNAGRTPPGEYKRQMSAEERLDTASNDSMDASDPPAISSPAGSQPVTSSGYSEHDERERLHDKDGA